MTARQSLDLAVCRITGKDIRMVGNWEPLPCLRDYNCEIANALNLHELELGACRDIDAIISLIERRPLADSHDIDEIDNIGREIERKPQRTLQPDLIDTIYANNN